MACHAHASPLDLRFAVATSCNAYFCYVFRDILDNPKYGEREGGLRRLERLCRELRIRPQARVRTSSTSGNGYVPDRGFLRPPVPGFVELAHGACRCRSGRMRWAARRCSWPIWRPSSPTGAITTFRTSSRRSKDRDSLDARFYERHYTKVDPKHFEPIVEGMWRGVNVGGTSTHRDGSTGLDVCGKTGTAENPRGRDHSTFLSFAPKDNPKIAISVYVENGGFGASAALPIASLLEEYYLTDTIRASGAAGVRQEHEHLLSLLMTRLTGITASCYGVDWLDRPAVRADRAGGVGVDHLRPSLRRRRGRPSSRSRTST